MRITSSWRWWLMSSVPESRRHTRSMHTALSAQRLLWTMQPELKLMQVKLHAGTD